MRFRPLLFSAAFLLAANVSYSQDNLVNALKSNQSTNSKDSFRFTDIVNLETTSVKNQGSSGTCWSYTTNSFLESEMIRLGKKPVELSQIFPARCTYIEKARNYVRMHGSVSLGDGGALHDVINIYRKYGALPRSVYSGLNYGTDKNKFAEMRSVTESMLKAVIQNPNGQLTPNWLNAYTAAIDAYLGEVPKSFVFEGKTYTPQSFAKSVVGIDPDEYVEISSFTDYPLYKKFTLLVPDNWSFDQVYNVQVDEMTNIIDHALKNGYTVAWATDVSEKGFSWKNGVAYVPEKDYEAMTEQEKAEMFSGPKAELSITPELRQREFDNYNTTDDHGMHIVGLAKDQGGKEYYIVKNSWGVNNDYQGFLYVTKNFVKLKTTSFLLNKKGIPSDIRKKLAI